MAQLTVNVPDAQLERVLAAFAATYGYMEEVPGDPPPPPPPDPNADPNAPVAPASPGPPPMKPNPESKRAFTKRMIQQHILSVVRGYEVAQASTKAQDTASKKVDSELTLS